MTEPGREETQPIRIEPASSDTQPIVTAAPARESVPDTDLPGWLVDYARKAADPAATEDEGQDAQFAETANWEETDEEFIPPEVDAENDWQSADIAAQVREAIRTKDDLGVEDSPVMQEIKQELAEDSTDEQAPPDYLDDDEVEDEMDAFEDSPYPVADAVEAFVDPLDPVDQAKTGAIKRLDELLAGNDVKAAADFIREQAIDPEFRLSALQRLRAHLTLDEADQPYWDIYKLLK